MKKFQKNIALCALMLCFVVALASCQNIHIHTFDSGWTSDETHHWQVCSSCQGIAQKAEHNWNEGEKANDFEMLFACKTCGHTKTEVVGTPYSLGLQYEQVENGLSVVGIGDCQDLELVLPSAVDGVPVVSVGLNAFRGTNIVSISVPESVETLESGAFADCANLVTINLAEGMKNLQPYAFANCTSLKSVSLPNSVTDLGIGIFQDCTQLESFSLGSGLAEVGNSMFFGCTSLTFVQLPSNITYIARRAFEHCTNLQSIVVGKDLVGIDTFAFLHAEQLANIYYMGTQQDWQNVNVKSSSLDPDCVCTVYYYSESQPTDTSAKYWHYVDGEVVVW